MATALWLLCFITVCTLKSLALLVSWKGVCIFLSVWSGWKKRTEMETVACCCVMIDLAVDDGHCGLLIQNVD